MIIIPGGEYRMGSDAFYPEERPVHSVSVREFALDRQLVTNRQFARFVDATGYVTVAERPLDAAQFPELVAEELLPGSLVFRPTTGPVDLGNWRAWWNWVPGASWRNPHGPETGIEDKQEHPVVQVCFTDASAYAAWAGKRLPTEIEWEFAARGGLDGATYAWGDELHPDGQLMANNWQGKFPYLNSGASGWIGTSPVGQFPPNGLGALDMIGNVWEWTTSEFTDSHQMQGAEDATGTQSAGCAGGCSCGPADTSQARDDVVAAAMKASPDSSSRRVTKGGSHLCAPEYCLRYRPAARSPQTEDSATTHLGFRCAADV
ncbi:formylglycine-generating enzyme family protein [Leifsonia sp. A12D58]|uniref:formylglycine-generating enzyme family protein n=1 Tax=Leifsonia sp. A12D58 TaxID=3397674 RepID=UPI0039E0BBE7